MVMTPATTAILAHTTVSEPTTELGAEIHVATIVIPEDEVEVMEVPTQEEAVKAVRTPDIHLDVVGSDVVVTVDTALLATLVAEESSRVSRTQDLSTYLSKRFNLTLAP